MSPEGKCYFRSCCCFTVKTGTTIFGVLQILGGIINMAVVSWLPNNDERHMDTPLMKQLRESVPLSLNPTTKVVYGIAAMISVIVAILLVRGNSQSKSKIMYPWVYWYYVSLTLTVVAKVIQVASSGGEMETSDMFIQFAAIVLAIVIGLLIVQVVRSRIADIEQGNRPDIPFTQRVPAN